jgi:hypothetical protein
MLKSTSLLRFTPTIAKRPVITTTFTRRFQTSTTQLAKMDAYKKVGNRENKPPKHEMVHFPGLMSEKRSFGDFRTVLHTGLYSQSESIPTTSPSHYTIYVRNHLC